MRVIETGFQVNVGSAAVSPDGRWLAAHPVAVKAPVLVWDLLDPSAAPVQAANARTGSVAFSPDGRSLARAAPPFTEEGVLVHPFPAGKRARRALPGQKIQAFAFTPDGRDLVGLGVDGRVHRWDTKAWAVAPTRLDVPAAEVYSHGAIALRPDGGLLAVSQGVLRDGELGSVLTAWDYPTALSPVRTVVCEVEVRALVFSPDGLHLAGLVRDGVIVWDAATFAVRTRLRPELSVRPPGSRLPAFGRPAFTPDGRFLALGGFDGTVRFFDTAKWAEHRVFDWTAALGRGRAYPPSDGRPVVCVLLTADGTRAVAAYLFELVVWDLDL